MDIALYCSESDIKLYLSDTLELLKKLPDNYIDMIFSDPPYNLSNNAITCHAGRMVSVNKGEWDKSKGVADDFEFHNSWISECKRILKPNGTIWISGTYHSIYQCGFSLQLNDFKILNEIAWFKPNASPNISCRYFTASHETIIWARKNQNSKHTFNYEEMKFGEWHKRDFIKKREYRTQCTNKDHRSDS